MIVGDVAGGDQANTRLRQAALIETFDERDPLLAGRKKNKYRLRLGILDALDRGRIAAQIPDRRRLDAARASACALPPARRGRRYKAHAGATSPVAAEK